MGIYGIDMLPSETPRGKIVPPGAIAERYLAHMKSELGSICDKYHERDVQFPVWLSTGCYYQVINGLDLQLINALRCHKFSRSELPRLSLFRIGPRKHNDFTSHLCCKLSHTSGIYQFVEFIPIPVWRDVQAHRLLPHPRGV